MFASIHQFLAASVFAVTALVSTTSVGAQDFPNKPVVMVVPYQAGGSVDAIARPLAAKLAKVWGQPVIVENRPGANGMIATQYVMKSPADGHTLLYHLTGIIQNPLIYKNVSYDPLKDFTPVIQIGGQAMGLAVPETSPTTTVEQLVADGRARGSTAHAYGSVGVGQTGHIWSELLTSEKSFKGSHAAYKGSGPMVIDLVSGRLDWAFLSSAESIVRSSDKSVRVLAVTGTKRIKQLPSVPTLREIGYPGFEMTGWHGIFAPARTPASIVAKIEKDSLAALSEPDMQAILELQVISPSSVGLSTFSKVMKDDQARWASLIKRFNIKVD